MARHLPPGLRVSDQLIGLSLSGVMLNLSSLLHNTTPAIAGKVAAARVQGNIQIVSTSIEEDSFTPIVVQKGIPVRWIIEVDGDKLNECNKAINVPEFKIEKDLVVGDNIVEFTPQEEGEFIYTCWMGMIKSKIKVVDQLDHSVEVSLSTSASTDNKTSSSLQKPPLEQNDKEDRTPQRAKSEGPAMMGEKCSAMKAGNESAGSGESNLNQIRFIWIDGMMCNNCMAHVRNALTGIEGVQVLAVEVGQAKVILHRAVSDDTLRDSVEQAGKYKVTSITAGGS